MGLHGLEHEGAQPFSAAGIEMGTERGAHLRVPLTLEVLGEVRPPLLRVGLGGEEGADLVGHLDQLCGVHAH
jgi:hypothetical protein